MAKDWQHFTKRINITDAAYGTELAAQGLPAGRCPDAWNLENPQAVAAVAKSFVEAGSDIIQTNTFQSNRFVLDRAGLAGKGGTVAEVGAIISRKAAGDAVAVFGSIGPSGKIVMTGEVAPEELYQDFLVQARGLARGGVDAIVCESFSELDEIALAARAALAAGLRVVMSMTFDSGPDRTVTMMGVRPAQLAALAVELGASAVGANCGAGPESFVRVAALLKAACPLPVWVKPNAGLPEVRGGKTIFPMDGEAFAAYAPALLSAGAIFLGGCCGTTPAHIRALARAVKA
jgi:methionine synthase I (cobalamin-dependent)